MPKLYDSIFDGPTIITKRDLCEMLNLDTQRPGLLFEPIEIEKAFRQRSLKFHPDKAALFNPPLPKEVAEEIFKDMNRAREHLIKNEDNIPGAAFQTKMEGIPKDWMSFIISLVEGMAVSTSVSGDTIPWIYRFSSDYLIMFIFSWYSNGELNFRFLNTFANELEVIRPFMQFIDGKTVATVLTGLKDILAATDELDFEKLAEDLKLILPETVSQHEKYNTLVLAIIKASKQLKATLTDDFIKKSEGIIEFWSDFVANVPTWKHIIGVYFISLLFTAASLPKFYNALKALSAVIIQHKGMMAFILVALPLLLLTTVMLPLNAVIQLGMQWSFVALVEGLKLLVTILQLLSSLAALIFTDQPQYHAFKAMEHAFDATVRLAINVIGKTLDALVYYITDMSLLSSALASINTTFDDFFAVYRPENKNAIPADPVAINGLTAAEDAVKTQDRTANAANAGFFSGNNATIFNAEDTWLNRFMGQLQANTEPNEAFNAAPRAAAI